MTASITFFGGAGGVTGSKHLVEVHNSRILLDCGTFQGLPDVRERNRSFPFAPDSIDAVVLSHAHLDHCGMLPLLVKHGFGGNIYATGATQAIARFMLEDAAEIEAQDASYRQRHHVGSPDEREPLFTRQDVEEVASRFVPIPYAREDGSWHMVNDRIRLKFYDAGHILGSAVSVIEIAGDPAPTTIAYTGDLGPKHVPLLHDPQVPVEEVSTLLLESTYGSRQHQPSGKAVERLARVVRSVCEQKGKVIVPAFSLGRTQLLVYMLHKLMDEELIPRVPVFVDSPLAADVTQVFRQYSHTYDAQSKADFPGKEHQPLSFQDLTYIQSVEQSKALNTEQGPFVVVSSSGMMTAGRVVHHLRHSISDGRNAVLITGYQAEGTTGRQLLEGADRVELHGEMFDVNARIHVFNEFSAHADSSQLQQYAEALDGLRHVILVHGEPHQADDLKGQLQSAHPDWQVDRPEEGSTITVSRL